MNSNATQATAASAYTAGALIMTVVIWLLSLRGITMPDPVAAAIGTLLGYCIHWIAMLVINRKQSIVAAVAVAKTEKAPILTPHI